MGTIKPKNNACEGKRGLGINLNIVSASLSESAWVTVTGVTRLRDQVFPLRLSGQRSLRNLRCPNSLPLYTPLVAQTTKLRTRELYARYLEDKERYTREKKRTSKTYSVSGRTCACVILARMRVSTLNCMLVLILATHWIVNSPTMTRFCTETTKNQVLHPHLFFVVLSPGTLSLDRFKDLVENALITFSTITAAEIQDRAKGDFLSKSIANLQTSWFIIQCIARGIQGLAITELELVTLALASLNGVIYYFWWDKPLDVNEPVQLYLMDPRATHEQVSHLGGINYMHQTKGCLSESCYLFANGLRRYLKNLMVSLRFSSSSTWHITTLSISQSLPLSRFWSPGQSVHHFCFTHHQDLLRRSALHWVELCLPNLYRKGPLANNVAIDNLHPRCQYVHVLYV